MKRTALNRIIPLVLATICAAAIFMFSNQNGMDSAEVSNRLLSKLFDMYNRIVPDAEFLSIDEFKYYDHLLRKAAHLFIYFILSILTCWSAWAIFSKRYMLISLLFCFVYACTDELHQNFSAGRNGIFSDVLIDTAGALIGIIYMTLIIACIRSINRSAGESIDKSPVK